MKVASSVFCLDKSVHSGGESLCSLDLDHPGNHKSPDGRIWGDNSTGTDAPHGKHPGLWAAASVCTDKMWEHTGTHPERHQPQIYHLPEKIELRCVDCDWSIAITFNDRRAKA